MSIIGWYYLHTNGDLLYKRELGGTAADIRESPFARALWPVDPEDRETAWALVVEATAAGAIEPRVAELCAKWHLTDEDATVYAERLGVSLSIVDPLGKAEWSAHVRDCRGTGPDARRAFAALAKNLGYRPALMWGPTFRTLVEEKNRTFS